MRASASSHIAWDGRLAKMSKYSSNSKENEYKQEAVYRRYKYTTTKLSTIQHTGVDEADSVGVAIFCGDSLTLLELSGSVRVDFHQRTQDEADCFVISSKADRWSGSRSSEDEVGSSLASSILLCFASAVRRHIGSIAIIEDESLLVINLGEIDNGNR